MGRYEFPEIDLGATESATLSGESLFELGLMYSAGNSVAVDLVSAHKWFNLAAMAGHADAARLRREIAAEMTDAEIGYIPHCALNVTLERCWHLTRPLWRTTLIDGAIYRARRSTQS